MLPNVENVENVDEVKTVVETPSQYRPLTRSKGTIFRYFPDRGYGFIHPDDNGLDVWFHKKNCNPNYMPAEGNKVIYLTRLGKSGLYALEVDRLSTPVFDRLYDQLYNRTNHNGS